MNRLDTHMTTLNNREDILELRTTWEEWIAERVTARTMMSLRTSKTRKIIAMRRRGISVGNQDIATSNMKTAMVFTRKVKSLLLRRLRWFGVESNRALLQPSSLVRARIKGRILQSQEGLTKMTVNIHQRFRQKLRNRSNKPLFQLWDKTQKILIRNNKTFVRQFSLRI